MVRAERRTFGEIVFNTSMTGYQEIISDPSYAGRLVTLTYPQVGGYGIDPAVMQRTFAPRGLSSTTCATSQKSNWTSSEKSLPGS